jgi:alkylated DNA repair protein (DNA oxidative demethylase)
MLTDLFADVRAEERLDEGAFIYPGFAASEAAALHGAALAVAAVSPFRFLVTPGGHTMSVAMTNCGKAGWVSDRRGYRYDRVDPLTQRTWPVMPEIFAALADRAAAKAGFSGFAPDVCLINRYEAGAKLHLHVDRDEHEFAFPIVVGRGGKDGPAAAVSGLSRRCGGLGRGFAAALSWGFAAEGRAARGDRGLPD